MKMNSTCRAECLRCGASTEHVLAAFCADWLRDHRCAPFGMAAVSCNVCGCYVSDSEAHLRWHEMKRAK